MFSDDIDADIKSAIIDVTDRCNLRCKHCFYFREEHASEELSKEEFLKGIKGLRDKYNILHMSWCGGEPLFRRDIIEEGASYFPMNWLFTNGTLPIPDIPNLMVFVSIDGPEKIHDWIRGEGTFKKIMENVKNRPENKVVIFLPTINRINELYLEEMVEQLSRIPNTFMGVEFFTPLKTYKDIPGYRYIEIQKEQLELSAQSRNQIIERLFELKKEYKGFIVVKDRVLELMLSKNAPRCIGACNMPRRCLTLDIKLNRKLPCVLGANVDCSKCGCIFPYEQQARREEKEKGITPDPLFFEA